MTVDMSARDRLEQVFRDAPGVRDAVAVQVPVGERGTGLALVAAHGEQALEFAALREHAAGALGEDQQPVAYGTVAALPQGADRDAVRAAVRDAAASGTLRLVRIGEAGTQDVSPRAVRALPWVRQIRLPLGRHARGSVNAYLVDTGDGVVLVDTGFASSREVLRDALRIGGVSPGQLRGVLVTHNHADHVGAARWLQESGWLANGGEVVMHQMTDFVGRKVFVEKSDELAAQLVRNGVDGADLQEWHQDIVDMAELAQWPEPDRLVGDLETLRVGELSLEFCYTPGHSPDHCAVVVRRGEQEAAFLGDLTLGRGMPMVGVRDWLREDPIADLLDSWQRLLLRTSAVGLPGHGGEVDDLAALHTDILAAHRAELQRFTDRFGGRVISAADAMRELTEASSPFGVRQFAFYGSLAILHHLAARGMADPVDEEPVRWLVHSHQPSLVPRS